MSTTKSSLEAQLFQAQENIENLSVEKEVFVQERTVMQQEIVYLQDKLAIATAEVSIIMVHVYCIYIPIRPHKLNDLFLRPSRFDFLTPLFTQLHVQLWWGKIFQPHFGHSLHVRKSTCKIHNKKYTLTLKQLSSTNGTCDKKLGVCITPIRYNVIHTSLRR